MTGTSCRIAGDEIKSYIVSYIKKEYNLAIGARTAGEINSTIGCAYPKEFEKTLDIIKQVGYMQLFTFIYSKRSGTKAALMSDATPAKAKGDRINTIKKIQEDITKS